MSTNPLNELAPYPRTVEEVTAESLSRHLTVTAWAHRTHRKTAISSTDREWATSEIVSNFGIVSVLRALQAVDEVKADEAAKGLWSAWDDGAAVGEWLHAWLTGFGIAPELVDAAASNLMRDAA